MLAFDFSAAPAQLTLVRAVLPSPTTALHGRGSFLVVTHPIYYHA